MKKLTKKIIATNIMILSCITMLGCNAKKEYSKRIDEKVAVIQKEDITLDNVDMMLGDYIDNLKEKYGDDFEKGINEALKSDDMDKKNNAQEDKKELIKRRNDFLGDMITTEVMYLKAIESGITMDDKIKESSELFINNMVDLNQDSNLDLDYVKSYFQKKYLAIEQEANIYKSITVSDEEINKYYEDNKSDYQKYAGYDIKELFFPIKNGDKDSANNLAMDTFFEMSSGNPNKSTDFITVYESALDKKDDYSKDGKIVAQENTINLKNPNRSALYLEYLEGTTVGSFTSPIVTDEGYYIPYIENIRRVDDVKTIDDVKDNIIAEIKYDKRIEVTNQAKEQYMKDFKVKEYRDILEF